MVSIKKSFGFKFLDYEKCETPRILYAQNNVFEKHWV